MWPFKTRDESIPLKTNLSYEQYHPVKLQNEEFRRDKRMLLFFLKRFEEIFGLDEIVDIDYSCPSMLKYSMFVLRMFRVFDKIDELKDRVS